LRNSSDTSEPPANTQNFRTSKSMGFEIDACKQIEFWKKSIIQQIEFQVKDKKDSISE
jgi:hypothetical protein